MNKIVLLMCGKNKSLKRAKAKDMYISERFHKSLEYALKLTDDNNIYVLSAKYGLLELETEIDYYDKSLYSFSLEDKKQWVENIFNQLKSKTNINEDIYVFLTDDDYSKHLVSLLKNTDLPLKGIDQNLHKDWFINTLSKLEGK